MPVRERLLVVMLAAVIVVVSAGPAPAHTKSDQGPFLGLAQVGKIGSCQQNGDAPAPTGGGLGVPGTTARKKAWWRLVAQLVTAQHPGGELVLVACGRMAPVDLTRKRVGGSPKVAVGASCGVSHGHDGWGEVRVGAVPHYRLRNIGWLVSAGGFFPVTADWWVPHPDGPFGKKTVGPVLMPIWAVGAGCPTKGTAPKSTGVGGENFTLVGWFDIEKFKASAPEPDEKKGMESTSD